MPLLHLFTFFFNHTATTEISTLSLHDALPISRDRVTTYPSTSPSVSDGTRIDPGMAICSMRAARWVVCPTADRKSTRLNSSHLGISYAVFCLKKKKRKQNRTAKRAINDDYIHS